MKAFVLLVVLAVFAFALFSVNVFGLRFYHPDVWGSGCTTDRENAFFGLGTLIDDTDKGDEPCEGGTLTWTAYQGNTQSIKDSCAGTVLKEWYMSDGEVYNPHYDCQNTCKVNTAGEGYCT